MEQAYLGVILYNTLADFEEKSTKRYVRDGIIIITQDNRFFTVHDWPTIEEIKAFNHKPDQRIALLTRDFFDYLSYLERQGINHLEECWEAPDEDRANPKKLAHVTYGSDVNNLEVPFDERLRGLILYSKIKDGRNFFTANLGFNYVGLVNMTASEEKIGKVTMAHAPSGLEELLEVHKTSLERAQSAGAEFLKDQHLCEIARGSFDNLMWYSEQAIPFG